MDYYDEEATKTKGFFTHPTYTVQQNILDDQHNNFFFFFTVSFVHYSYGKVISDLLCNCMVTLFSRHESGSILRYKYKTKGKVSSWNIACSDFGMLNSYTDICVIGVRIQVKKFNK